MTFISDRPHMPSGYGINASVEGLLNWGAVSERLMSARNYWLATAGKDTRPHVMPVWGLWQDEAFFFSTDTASRKGKNLALNPYVVVHLESGDDVVIIEGRTEAVRDVGVLNIFADAYEMKYSFRPDVNSAEARVYRLYPKAAFAWREKDFPTSATRWSFSQRKRGTQV